jgi:hypothetical protein
MWKFWYGPLQLLAGSVLVATFWWLTNLVRTTYKADASKVHRIVYRALVVVSEVSTPYVYVSAGLHIGMNTNHGLTIYYWFILLFNVLGRLLWAQGVAAQKRSAWALGVIEKAKSESEYLETRAAAWSREMLIYQSKPFPDRYVAYLLVSTLVWLWVALYFALIWWRP